MRDPHEREDTRGALEDDEDAGQTEAPVSDEAPQDAQTIIPYSEHPVTPGPEGAR